MTATSTNPVAPNANTLWAQLLVDELARCGLERVVVSPGSRSTPLVVAFSEDERIEDLSIIDERSAGFFALGYARATGRPAALVCTSGTAAANFFPAICEASNDGVPLLVLTADRPPHLQDCGASQAMDQTKLYGRKVRWFHQLGQPEASVDKLRYVRATACRAYAEATGEEAGPVHLNLPFRKPLEPVEVPESHRDGVDNSLEKRAPLAVRGRSDGAPFVDIRQGRRRASSSIIEAFAKDLSSCRRPLFWAGADWCGSEYARSLCALARRLQAPVIAEPTSGLRALSSTSEQVITAGDFLFESRFYDALGDPDFIVRTGKFPLLWAAKDLVSAWSEVPQTVICRHKQTADPARVVERHLMVDEASFFDTLATMDFDGPSASAREHWSKLHRRAQRRAIEVFRETVKPLCEEGNKWGPELGAAHIWALIGDELGEGEGLFVSSSMPIRDVDTFMCAAGGGVELYANRGLNGIDGVISTGLAVARARRRHNKGATVIVVGDVALRHDLGALRLAAELGIDATVVVIDNDGGAIFEYLPIAEFGDVHERHFATAGRSSLDAVVSPAALWEPSGADEFRRMMRDSMESAGTQLLRVSTERRRDIRTRNGLRRIAADAIDDMITSREIHN